MAKQSSRRCSLTSLDNLTLPSSHISALHQLIYPCGEGHSARSALSSTSSRSHCRTMLVPHMFFHGRCLTTMVWSYIMWTCVAIKNTTKYIYQSQIHLLARPNLVNDSCLTESVMGTLNLHKYASITPSQLGHILLQPSIQYLFPPHPCLDLNTVVGRWVYLAWRKKKKKNRHSILIKKIKGMSWKDYKCVSNVCQHVDSFYIRIWYNF